MVGKVSGRRGWVVVWGKGYHGCDRIVEFRKVDGWEECLVSQYIYCRAK